MEQQTKKGISEPSILFVVRIPVYQALPMRLLIVYCRLQQQSMALLSTEVDQRRFPTTGSNPDLTKICTRAHVALP